MAQEGNLPPGDTGWAKVAPPLEHGAPEEVLLVDNSMDNNTPHFHFISFQLNFYYLQFLLSLKGSFFVFQKTISLHILITIRGVIQKCHVYATYIFT